MTAVMINKTLNEQPDQHANQSLEKAVDSSHNNIPPIPAAAALVCLGANEQSASSNRVSRRQVNKMVLAV